MCIRDSFYTELHTWARGGAGASVRGLAFIRIYTAPNLLKLNIKQMTAFKGHNMGKACRWAAASGAQTAKSSTCMGVWDVAFVPESPRTH